MQLVECAIGGMKLSRTFKEHGMPQIGPISLSLPRQQDIIEKLEQKQ